MAGVGILVVGIFVSVCCVQGTLENVALNKKTEASRIHPNWTASNAVDGNNEVTGGAKTCYHAAYDVKQAYWSVDLGQEYQLYTVRVYLRSASPEDVAARFVTGAFSDRVEDRTANSSIYLDNNPSRVCYTFPSNITDNPTNVTCNDTVRHVTIRNPGNDTGFADTLNICEVEIYACSNGSYGIGCSETCNNCSHCDRWSGICSGECYPGWSGERCDKPCSNGSYGSDCGETCNCPHCDGQSGICSSDCHPGLTGERCDKRCDSFHYGENCSNVCSNRHCEGTSPCDHVTGSCDQGCQSGWRNTDCTEACNNTYGKNCNKKCVDRKCSGNSTSCDPVTGTCDTGCLPGWKGADCTEACNNTYGIPCTEKCVDRKCVEKSASCYRVSGSCDTGWNRTDCSERKEQARDHGTDGKSLSLTLIAGAAGGGVVFLVLILILIIVLIRRQRLKDSPDSPGFTHRNAKENESSGAAYVNVGFAGSSSSTTKRQAGDEASPGAGPSHVGTETVPRGVVVEEEEEENQEEEEENVQQDKRASQPDNNYYNLDEAHRNHVIPVSELEVRVREMGERPETSEQEFKHLVEGFLHPYDDSQTPERTKKNRFRGYYPYNYNRVVLHEEKEGSKGDYINASYIDGYNHVRKYIAAQGPYRSDIEEDFWRMIWQEGCIVVVMVTALVEEGRMKCLCYWPEKGTSRYGDVTVTKETETTLADYTITKLTVQRGKDTQKRHVTHFNFTSWPDQGVPDTSSLLNFMWRIQNTCGQQKRPIVVHCSAGIGRTGTYIAIESLIQQAKAEEAVNVVSIVSEMRNQRKNMIQNKEQYMFVYKTVAVAVLQGDTSLDADVIRKVDLGHVNDVIIGNRTVQQHLEILDRHCAVTPSDTVIRVPSYYNWYGFYIMTSRPDMEEVWNYILNSGTRTMVTWSSNVEQYFPISRESMTTKRVAVRLHSTDALSDNVDVQQLEIKGKNEKRTSIIFHYHVTGSVRDASITVMIDSLVQRTSQPECGSISIISDSVVEARLLVLLVNITSRLQDDGKVDVIDNMRRLQSVLGGPSFTEDDVQLCLKYCQRRLESLGLYANL